MRSLKTQRRIVARIEGLFAELGAARRLHAALAHDAERLMDAALWKTFGEIREGFEVSGISSDQVKGLGKVCRLQRGKFSHRPRNDPQFFGGDIPWMQIGDIPKDYSKNITTHMDTLNKEGLAISRLFPVGTIVISIAATIGAVGILSFDACFPDSLVGITPDTDKICSDFLYWQLCFMQSHLESVAPYAAQRNINLGILRKIDLWVPSLKTQEQVTTHLDKVQIQAAELERTAAAVAADLDRLEQSILAQAFKGKL
jgi:type I restriction enzyme, S subunit